MEKEPIIIEALYDDGTNERWITVKQVGEIDPGSSWPYWYYQDENGTYYADPLDEGDTEHVIKMEGVTTAEEAYAWMDTYVESRRFEFEE